MNRHLTLKIATDKDRWFVGRKITITLEIDVLIYKQAI
jgi:hypothetical protein